MPNVTTVTLVNGVPTAPSGTVSTIDALMAVVALETGGNLAAAATSVAAINTATGATADAVVAAGAAGSLSAKLRAISRDLVANVVLAAGANVIGAVTQSGNWVIAAGANLIGKVGIDQTTPGTTNGVQVNAALPAGTNIIGAALAALSAAANGLTSSRVNSAATTNATSLKASAGNVGEIDVFNNAAYAVYLKFYNKASAPTVGTDTPTWTIPIPSGGGFARSFPRGKSFATGIAYAITKLQADSDTTVIVAGDLTGSIDWI